MRIRTSDYYRTRLTRESGRNSFFEVICLIAALSAATACFGQNSAFQIGSSSTSSQFEQMFGVPAFQETADKTFFEGVVDPNDYHVGPGDRLKVYFWQPAYREYQA